MECKWTLKLNKSQKRKKIGQHYFHNVTFFALFDQHYFHNVDQNIVFDQHYFHFGQHYLRNLSYPVSFFHYGR